VKKWEFVHSLRPDGVCVVVKTEIEWGNGDLDSAEERLSAEVLVSVVDKTE
jgi:hypothetical protein